MFSSQVQRSEQESLGQKKTIKDNIFRKYFQSLGGVQLSFNPFFNYQPALITYLLKKDRFRWTIILSKSERGLN